MDEMRDHVSEDGAQEDTKKKKSPFSKKLVIPSKKQINFADIGKTEMKLSVLIPGIILIIAGASLLSKFLVVDRIMEVSALQSEVSTLRSQIDEEQAVIDSMQDVAIKFAHSRDVTSSMFVFLGVLPSDGILSRPVTLDLSSTLL